MTATEVPVVALHAKALSAFDAVVEQVGADQWTLPTPCSEWNVHTLVNHVLGEARWSAPLLAGSTIEEVGDRFEGDLLGADPLAAWVAGREEAAAASAAPQVVERSVHLSFGLTPAEEYLRQLTADYLIHSWDLAVAIGADTRLDAGLVDAVEPWFVARAAAYRAGGAVAAQVPTTAQDDPQRRLLGMFGRDTDTCVAVAAVARFSAASDRRDVDAMMAAMTDDCVFESTTPPDGVRYEGQAAVRAAWTDFFASSASPSFATEEQIACGDRVVVRWRYDWADGHVRGVDVYRVRDRLIAEKASYVKG